MQRTTGDLRNRPPVSGPSIALVYLKTTDVPLCVSRAVSLIEYPPTQAGPDDQGCQGIPREHRLLAPCGPWACLPAAQSLQFVRTASTHIWCCFRRRTGPDRGTSPERFAGAMADGFSIRVFPFVCSICGLNRLTPVHTVCLR